jgi:hypothetical protein
MKTFIIDISIFGVLMIVGYISNCILEKIYIDNFLESLFIKSGTIMIAYVILLKLTGLIDYLYKYVKRK